MSNKKVKLPASTYEYLKGGVYKKPKQQKAQGSANTDTTVLPAGAPNAIK